MNNPVDQINEVRRRQGRKTLPNPNVIQGFGPDDPPPPSEPEIVPAIPADAPADWIPQDAAPSPLAELGRTVTAMKAQARLFVMDHEARVDEHRVTLGDKEVKAITAIILRCAVSGVRTSLKNLERSIPKRTYRKVKKRT